MKLPKNLGMILLAIFLILYGVTQRPLSVNFQYHDVILGILAIVSGILLLLGR